MILLAGPTSELLRYWKQGLDGFPTATSVGNMEVLLADMARIKPDVLMLDMDLPDLDGAKGAARLLKLHAATKIIALASEPCDIRELGLFRIGVRGCCCHDIAPDRVKLVIKAVQQGELWIRRTLTPRLLDELGARIRADNEGRRAAMARLADLTRREREIAELVGNGESNKQIARELTITESTVKAHLTEIFRKLGIADRLKLALLIVELAEV
ncbi:LuxR C-terminal-related transcriptional regulator [Massilia litorea]|jgi:two-component system NarL family response regulator|uniref:Response regulator transcription factor n=1 Tax=Massilia litorea TaxID=2769491 RepID=A0A7L9U3X7_9BURK|nr:response regulator transcription factor [Massilia litorea]QOL49119.1 response regulator transcription factor [Massilia litorea]